MSYVIKPSLLEVVAYKYPDAVLEVVGSDPNVYVNLVWTSVPIAEATLIIDQLEIYRQLCDSKIREDAQAKRYEQTLAVLGTKDPEQIRTYEEKYTEADAYLVYNASPTPIMSAEILHTGETIAALAALVVSQYDAAKAQLKSLWGNIEGVRRANIATVSTSTVVELEAYAGPTWT